MRNDSSSYSCRYLSIWIRHIDVMSANSGGIQQRIMAERKEVADAEEPLLTETVQVGTHGAHGSLKHTVPATIAEVLDLGADDEVVIEGYQDGYVVRKK